MKLLKTINDLVRDEDPINRVLREMQERIDALDKDQLNRLAGYVKDVITSGDIDDPSEAARQALENVAGFETADESVVNKVVRQIVSLYTQQKDK